MNKYDWKNAFPKPSENFHNKLCMTLDSFEKENVKMKKYLLKRVSLLRRQYWLSAQWHLRQKGAVNYVMGSTSTKPDYTNHSRYGNT